MGINDDLAAKLAFEPEDRKLVLQRWHELQALIEGEPDEVLAKASVGFSRCYLDEGVTGDMVEAGLKAAGIAPAITTAPGFDGRKA